MESEYVGFVDKLHEQVKAMNRVQREFDLLSKGWDANSFASAPQAELDALAEAFNCSHAEVTAVVTTLRAVNALLADSGNAHHNNLLKLEWASKADHS